MTDDQFRELRTMIQNLAVEIERIKLHLKKQDEIATFRQNLIYEWCAPPAYKAYVDAQAIDIPDDLKRFLPDQN